VFACVEGPRKKRRTDLFFYMKDGVNCWQKMEHDGDFLLFQNAYGQN
jgi:hypothetical protein